MLTREQKAKIAEDFAEKFRRQKIAIFSDFHGISVSKLQILRRLLKKSGGEYKVAKKTILDIALQKAELPLKVSDLKSEVGVALGYEDEISVAKNLFKFGKENETFKILRGILGGRILSDKEAIALARIPGRETLLAKLAGALQFPLRGLVFALAGTIKNLVAVLDKINKNKQRGS